MTLEWLRTKAWTDQVRDDFPHISSSQASPARINICVFKQSNYFAFTSKQYRLVS